MGLLRWMTRGTLEPGARTLFGRVSKVRRMSFATRSRPPLHGVRPALDAAAKESPSSLYAWLRSARRPGVTVPGRSLPHGSARARTAPKILDPGEPRNPSCPSAQQNVHAAQWSSNGGPRGLRPDRAERLAVRGQRLLGVGAARTPAQAHLQGAAGRAGRGRARSIRSLADTVAQAMREWAMEKGATHYTHWFQPLTNLTAEKHDGFFEPDRRRRRARRVLRQGAHPGRARRLLVPERRPARDLRGPGVHRLGPDLAGVRHRQPERRAALHPDRFRLLDRRRARPQDPAAALDGRALQGGRQGARAARRGRASNGSSPRSAPSRSTS